MKYKSQITKLTIKEPSTDIEFTAEGISYEYEGNLQETTSALTGMKDCIVGIIKEGCQEFVAAYKKVVEFDNEQRHHMQLREIEIEVKRKEVLRDEDK